MRQAVFHVPFFAAALYILAAPPAIAQSDIRTERVQFKRGANNAVIQGKLIGRKTVDYVLKASKGQHMNVSMATDNGANYFNILAPGENEVAMFIGSSAGNQYEGVLPKTGDYKIRVYIMRSAARRNEIANYRLEMIVSGSADKSPTAEASTPEIMMAQCRARAGEVMKTRLPDIETKYEGQRTDGTHAVNGTAFIEGGTKTFQCSFNRPGREIIRFVVNRNEDRPATGDDSGRFNATGNIPCARYAGQPMNQCRFGVVRKGQGNGSVTVFWPDGGNRVIFFENGTPASFDQSQADGDVRMTVGRNVDLFMVTIGDQRFEIPEAVITGG